MIFSTTYEKNNSSLLAQLKEADKYLPWINEAAKRYDLQPCVIAGLGSRESHWGLALRPEGPSGTGDFAERKPKPTDSHFLRSGTMPPDGLGYGRGQLQIDYDWHEFARTGNWQDPRENILYGCKTLALSDEYIRCKLEKENLLCEFSDKEELRLALAGYNAGVGGALKAARGKKDIDFYTSGHNYSIDVLDRAGWWQYQGWT